MKKIETVKISIDNKSTTNNGNFEGWGTSLCWWANRIGYNDYLTKKAAELFFSKKGLNLNIMRYNIGGGDDPTHHHIKRTDSIIPGWLTYDKENDEYIYNYDADSNQINVLKEANKASGKDAFVEVFSNSPPYFMTKSGCSSGGANPNKNNLREDCYESFAEYLANVTDYINNTLGIKVSSLSPMNEPNTAYWKLNSEKQEGCHFDSGDSQNRIILETAKALKQKDLSHVQIIGSDETSTGKQLTSYKKYSKEVKNIIDRVSTHSYGTYGIKRLGTLMKEENKNLWMSETDWSGTYGEDAGEMSAALWLSKKIIYDINGLSPSAWVLWQVIDNHISEEGYMGNIDFGMPDITKGFWGLAVADHDKNKIVLTQKYYAMGQFSRYIRPGDTIIHCNNSTLAAFNKKNNRVIVVSINGFKDNKEICFNFYGFKSIGKKATVIRTSGDSEKGEKWADIGTTEITDNKLYTELKGNSVTTFIIE